MPRRDKAIVKTLESEYVLSNQIPKNTAPDMIIAI